MSLVKEICPVCGQIDYYDSSTKVIGEWPPHCESQKPQG